MARGRIGKPVSTHIKDGTFNVTRHGKNQLPVMIPPMPQDMGPVEQACWKTITQDLEKAGNIAEIDGRALRLICEAEAIRLDTLDNVKKYGFIIKGNASLVMNPAVRVYFAAWDRELKGLMQFGATPVARRGMDLESQNVVDDPEVARILKIKQA